MTRRTLLKLGGLGGALVLAGAWIYGKFIRLSPPGEGLQCLSEEEFRIGEAVADTFFPGPPISPLSAKEVAVGQFADGLVAGFYPDQQRLFKLLLVGLNVSTLAKHGRTFVELPLDARRAVLHAWQGSRLMVKRAANSSLTFVFSMGYFEHPRVRAALGIRHGCDLSHRLPGATLVGEG